MKSPLKRIFSFALVLVLALSALPAQAAAVSPAAADPIVVSLEKVTAKPGDTVTVPVRLKKNPGLVSAKVEISYDSNVMTLVEAKDTGLLKGPVFNGNIKSNPYSLMWQDSATTNNMATGVIANVTFKIKDNAPKGDYALKLSYGLEAFLDAELNELTAVMENGTVAVNGNGGGGNEGGGDEGGGETAKTAVVVAMDQVSAKPGDTIVVPLRLTKNDGLVSAKVEVSYDSKVMTLVKAEDTHLLRGAIFNGNIKSNPYTLMWQDSASTNNTSTGVIANLTFKVKDTADAGKYELGLSYDLEAFLDADLNDLSATMRNGSVTVKAPEAPKFKLLGANVAMGNNLDMNFAIPGGAMADWSGCYAQITKATADGTEPVVVTIPAEKWTPNMSNYVITFHGIAAKEMANQLSVTIYNAQGKAVSETWTDSMRDYAMRMLGKRPSAALRTLMVDMLNYGSEAQRFFQYGEKDLANGKLSAEQKGFASQSKALENKLSAGSNWLGTNLTLNNSIELRLAFRNVQPGMSAKVEFTNHMGEKISKTIPYEQLEDNSGAKVVLIDSVVVADARQLVTVTILDADGSEYSVTQESIESYLARQKNLSPLFGSIMQFADSAYAFLHQ